MKKIRIIPLLMTAVLIAVSLAGCGGSTVKTSGTDTASKPEQNSGQQGSGQRAPQGGRSFFAKVVSLNSDQLTVILADRARGNQNGTPPAIEMQPGNDTPPAIEMQPGNGTPPPGDGNGPGVPKNDSNQPEMRGEPEDDSFTGEEVIYTLSNNVVVTKGVGDSAQEIDLSELTAGDVIRFTTVSEGSGDEEIDTIVVMN